MEINAAGGRGVPSLSSKHPVSPKPKERSSSMATVFILCFIFIVVIIIVGLEISFATFLYYDEPMCENATGAMRFFISISSFLALAS
jgi:hypothetical protein